MIPEPLMKQPSRHSQRPARELQPPVAQVVNLLYRRLAVGRALAPSRGLRIANPRYSRLPVCATVQRAGAQMFSGNSLRGFTLVELLVVITIIALLAGLIVGGAGIASVKQNRARAEAERDALILAIQSYHNDKGYYPPDNTNNPALSPLFYELTGTVLTNGNFLSTGSQEFFKPTDVQTVFKIGGFNNSSADPTQPARNFLPSTAKTGRTALFYISGNSGPTFTLFGLGVKGPSDALTNDITGRRVNPWHYVSTNPTNSADYDLWIDVVWSGKTNRISNWSKEPKVL